MRTFMIVVAVAALGTTGLARQGRPHLQVLSDIPESQLFLVMNAVADSLGVGCEHCHVRTRSNPNTVVGDWQFDRNDKPAKARGREMMRMVRDINASQFGGRPVVTCFTCHHGELRVAGTPPLPPRDRTAFPTPPPAALPSAPEVLQKYIKTVGGGDVGTRFATTVMEGRDERSEGRRGDLTMSLKGSDRFRADLRFTGQFVRAQGINAAGGWTWNGIASQPIDGESLRESRRRVARYAPLKVVDPADALRIDRIESIRGRDAYVAVAVVDATRTRSYFFDVATGLLVRENLTTTTPLVPLQEQMEYDDYRSVDGVMLPFLIRFSDDAPFDTYTRTFTRITHNVPLEDAVFEPPRAPQEQKKAGERYKNDRILTDAPASSIVPTKAFVSNSLGVTCLYCHTDVYESDENPMKDKARQMIQMTRAINEDYNGRSRRDVPDVPQWQRHSQRDTGHRECRIEQETAPADTTPLRAVDAVIQLHERAVGVEALKTRQNRTLAGTVTRNSGRTAAVGDTFEPSQQCPSCRYSSILERFASKPLLRSPAHSARTAASASVS